MWSVPSNYVWNWCRCIGSQVTYKCARCCRLVAERSKAASKLEELSSVQAGVLRVKLPPALANAGRPAQWGPQQLLDAQLDWPMPVSSLVALILQHPLVSVNPRHLRHAARCGNRAVSSNACTPCLAIVVLWPFSTSLYTPATYAGCLHNAAVVVRNRCMWPMLPRLPTRSCTSAVCCTTPFIMCRMTQAGLLVVQR